MYLVLAIFITFRNSAGVDCLTLKSIGCWIQQCDMKMLFKFQVNWMKIEDFRKFGPNWLVLISKLICGWIQDLMCKWSSNFKYIGWKLTILETIKNFGMTLWHMLTFWSMITSKVIGGWIHLPDVQFLFKFQVNRMKFEDFGKFGSNWPIGLCRPFLLTEFYETSMQDRHRVGNVNLKIS